jgi:uroporphyrinogen decarboxylase
MKSKIGDFFDRRFSNKLPVIPLVGIHAAHVGTINIQKALNDGHLMAEAALHALRSYGYDGVFTFMDLTLEAEALGCEIQYHRETVPSVKKVLFRDVDDYDLIEISNVENDNRIAEFLHAAEIISESIDHSKTISGAYVTAPFTLAGQLMGMEAIFESMILDPDGFKQVLEKTEEITTIMIEKYVNRGVDLIVVLDPMASPDLISPLHFEEFAGPYLQQVTGTAHLEDTLVTLHICGNTTNILTKMIECGVDAISIDSDVDMNYAAYVIKDRAVLIGNIDPVGILLDGSAEDVQKATTLCIEHSSKARFFILSSGCEVPKNTPRSNIDEMVRSARKYGQPVPVFKGKDVK